MLELTTNSRLSPEKFKKGIRLASTPQLPNNHAQLRDLNETCSSSKIETTSNMFDSAIAMSDSMSSGTVVDTPSILKSSKIFNKISRSTVSSGCDSDDKCSISTSGIIRYGFYNHKFKEFGNFNSNDIFFLTKNL